MDNTQESLMRLAFLIVENAKLLPAWKIFGTVYH